MATKSNDNKKNVLGTIIGIVPNIFNVVKDVFGTKDYWSDKRNAYIKRVEQGESFDSITKQVLSTNDFQLIHPFNEYFLSEAVQQGHGWTDMSGHLTIATATEWNKKLATWNLPLINMSLVATELPKQNQQVQMNTSYQNYTPGEQINQSLEPLKPTTLTQILGLDNLANSATTNLMSTMAKKLVLPLVITITVISGLVYYITRKSSKK